MTSSSIHVCVCICVCMCIGLALVNNDAPNNVHKEDSLYIYLRINSAYITVICIIQPIFVYRLFVYHYICAYIRIYSFLSILYIHYNICICTMYLLVGACVILCKLYVYTYVVCTYINQTMCVFVSLCPTYMRICLCIIKNILYTLALYLYIYAFWI